MIMSLWPWPKYTLKPQQLKPLVYEAYVVFMLKMFCLKLQCVGSVQNNTDVQTKLLSRTSVLTYHMTMNVWCFEDLRHFRFWYISAILRLGSRRKPISEIIGSRSGIEPWPLAPQAKSLTNNHYTTAAPDDNEGWTKNICFFLSLSICLKKLSIRMKFFYTVIIAYSDWEEIFANWPLLF